MDSTITWEARSSKAGKRDLARIFPVAIGVVGIISLVAADVQWPPPWWAWLLLVPFLAGCLMHVSAAIGTRMEVAEVNVSPDGLKVVATRSSSIFAKRKRVDLDIEWSEVLSIRPAQEIVLDGATVDVVYIDLAQETVLGRSIRMWMFANQQEAQAWAASATALR